MMLPIIQVTWPDPEMLLPGGGGGGGGGTESQSLEPSGKSCKAARGGGEYERGGVNPLSLGGPPPENFVKSMYLRTHFKPF